MSHINHLLNQDTIRIRGFALWTKCNLKNEGEGLKISRTTYHDGKVVKYKNGFPINEDEDGAKA